MNLTDQVHKVIKDEITTCVLEPGQQISQLQLSQRYGFGLTPVREALRRLAQEGLVQSVPRFGYIVSSITLCDVREIFELRSILELAAVRLAVVRGTQEQLETIAQDAGFTYVYRDRKSYSDFLVHNAEFHRSIAILSDNRRLIDQISRLLNEMTRIFHLGLDLKDSAQEMHDEHVALAEAILQRDANLAEHLVQSQIVRSQERVLEAMTSRFAALERTVKINP
jgi:DNA-binding GntR family transcriptional regulator